MKLPSLNKQLCFLLLFLRVVFESKQLCEPVFAASSTKVAWYNCNKQTGLTGYKIIVNHLGNCVKLESLLKIMCENNGLTFSSLYLHQSWLQDYCKSCGWNIIISLFEGYKDPKKPLSVLHFPQIDISQNVYIL